MERLFYFLYQYRAFFTFLVLEIFSAWLIIQNNQYHNVKFFNSSNRIAANMLGVTHNINEYFSLRRINSDLAQENAQLRTRLQQLSQLQRTSSTTEEDTTVANFEFVSAKVVNNSTALTRNHITIDKGVQDGIEQGMAVIGSSGIVGKVKSVSSHFSVLMPVINTDEMVSSTIQPSGNFGSIQWDGVDPRYVKLEFIPRHAHPEVGDTVVTSGFNAVFPEGILVGTVYDVSLGEGAPFYDITVELAEDFSRLAFVEVVKSIWVEEIDSLESTVIEEE